MEPYMATDDVPTEPLVRSPAYGFIYYDPLKPTLSLVHGAEPFRKFVAFTTAQFAIAAVIVLLLRSSSPSAGHTTPLPWF